MGAPGAEKILVFSYGLVGTVKWFRQRVDPFRQVRFIDKTQEITEGGAVCVVIETEERELVVAAEGFVNCVRCRFTSLNSEVSDRHASVFFEGFADRRAIRVSAEIAL